MLVDHTQHPDYEWLQEEMRAYLEGLPPPT